MNPRTDADTETSQRPGAAPEAVASASAAAPAPAIPARSSAFGRIRVGMFDSGIGGISVAKAFLRLRPEAEVRYVADWEYCPYGTKDPAVILDRARALTAQLLAQGCQVIVLACNTASAVALATLRAEHPGVPFVGMEPAIKPAAAQSRTGVVGILATGPTLHGDLLRHTAERHARGVRIHAAEGEGFVALAESGDWDSAAAVATARRVLEPLLSAQCDPIVLGCTHYPLLLPALRKAAPEARFLDPCPAVARRIAFLCDRVAGGS